MKIVSSRFNPFAKESKLACMKKGWIFLAQSNKVLQELDFIIVELNTCHFGATLSTRNQLVKNTSNALSPVRVEYYRSHG